MKELDFTGEWLTRDGSKALVTPAGLYGNRLRFKLHASIITAKGKMSVFLDADGKCPGFSGWDLQKRLDGFTE